MSQRNEPGDLGQDGACGGGGVCVNVCVCVWGWVVGWMVGGVVVVVQMT